MLDARNWLRFATQLIANRETLINEPNFNRAESAEFHGLPTAQMVKVVGESALYDARQANGTKPILLPLGLAAKLCLEILRGQRRTTPKRNKDRAKRDKIAAVLRPKGGKIMP